MNRIPDHPAEEVIDEVFDSVASYFLILSEPTRLKIMHSICEGEKSVNTIVDDSGATQTNVSRHLGMMHRAGLLQRRREGSLIFYRIADPDVLDICRTVCERVISSIERQQPLPPDLLEYFRLGKSR